MHYLQALNGPQSGQRYSLTEGEYVLGRDPSQCNILVDVGAVSRRHARLLRDGLGGYILEDLGSRNGTYLNQEMDKIEGRRPLRAGDEIRVCEVTYLYHADVPQPAASPVRAIDGAGMGAEMTDDDASSGGANILKSVPVDVSSVGRSVHVSASAEVKLAALIEITQNLGKALSLDDVLPQVLKSLFKIFVQADRGFIVLKTPDDKLIPRWVRLRKDDNGESIRISRTIIRTVMDSKQAILSADAATDERFEMSQSIADFRIRSMMCAPLLDGEGNAFGAIQIDTLNQRQRFQPEDLELLVSTAAQASIAIQNAQMYEATIKQKELDRDMELAREVQRGFLPDSRPNIEGYEFFDYYQPADQVGGDYYDYVSLPDGKVAIVVADVVGHGVAAALLMAKLSAETRFSLYTEPVPATAITRLNEKLSALNIQRFVTFIAVVLDPVKHEATIVNAGHMAPLHRRAAGNIEEPSDQIAGLPLGITDAISYEQVTVPIAPGEVMILYTDGINEAIDASGAFFTIDRMRAQVTKNPSAAPVIGQILVDDVRAFLGKAPQNDDMCLVCIGRKA